MAVAVVIQFSGGTTDQYDQVIAKMGFTHGGAGAPGSKFHWIAETPEGLRVTDVWDSPEQFEKFAEEQIGPFTQEAGIPGPPQITIHEIYNYMTAG